MKKVIVITGASRGIGDPCRSRSGEACVRCALVTADTYEPSTKIG